ANFALDTVYNGNWFGKWINKIDRSRGTILDSITVGEAPTHIITIPTPGAETGVLTILLSADNDMVKVRDSASGLEIIDSEPTGQGKTHPHGHWLTCGLGDRTIVPNVFKGGGPCRSIRVLEIIDSEQTGQGKTHPHGHWLTCGLGDRTIVPNVFKGIGPAGSISILD